MTQLFSAVSAGLCFWLAVEACILMRKRADATYGWFSLMLLTLGAFHLYSLIVGK